MAVAHLQVIKIPAVHPELSTLSVCSKPPLPPVPPTLKESDVVMVNAVAAIEHWWLRVRNRRVFTLLKDAVCSAEHSLTQEVLRKMSPREAELLRDPAMRARVKFRFGGSEFPPAVLFKIFVTTRSKGGVHYISGKKMIRPASEAAYDARRQMGNRCFYDQMLSDACQHYQLRITDEVDVTTMKEYMQFMAVTDESPAHLGGKDNTWRRMNHDILPRHSFMHSIVELLTSSCLLTEGRSLDRLQGLLRPPTQSEQIKYIKTVSSLSCSSSPLRLPSLTSPSSQPPSRRTRQAQKRVERMRRAYLETEEAAEEQGEEEKLTSLSVQPSSADQQRREGMEGEGGEEGEGLESWERDADDLYQWTQELSFEEIG